jgi:hypothetical protein
MQAEKVPAPVIEWAQSRPAEFGADELMDEMGISRPSALIYLSRMERNGAISRLMRGRYVSAIRKPSRRVLKVIRVLAGELPLTPLAVWSTDALVHFSHHIPARHFVFVDARPQDAPSVLDALKEAGLKAAAEPERGNFSALAEMGAEVFVRMQKTLRGTIPWKGNVSLVILERVLVDLYVLSARDGFPLPKEDIAVAVAAAVGQGAADRRTLRRYATRRYVYPELKTAIEGG